MPEAIKPERVKEISLAAMDAALATEGVSRMVDVPINNMLENLISGTAEARGIRAWIERKSLNIMVFLNVSYGCKIPTTAWNVQSNIKNRISGMTDLDIGRIDINIQGVDCPDTGEEQ